ncbi:hypothetical protein DL765_002217 [Monosporascus sp. GIB2]|nr:hypothetical protein DL765_002217 [Monosporascus sp. GIB2]
MYFGLLSAILCKAIDRDTTTRPDNGGRRTIDSTKVVTLLKERRKIISRTPPALRDREEQFRAVYILKDTWDIVNGPMLDYLLTSGFHDRSDLWSEPLYAVIFSIDVFLDQLDDFVRRPDRVYGLGSRDLRRCNLVAGFPPFRNSIRKSGRCSSLAWCLQLSASDWYRLLFLPNHAPPRDHSDCNDRRCKQYGSTKTRHRDGCPVIGCVSLRSDMESVLKCISEDGLPLIQCEEDEHGEVRIETVRGNLLSNYTAISHVWSGGMGNQAENTLPRCQLRYLLHSIADLPPPPPLSIHPAMSSSFYNMKQSLTTKLPSQWRSRRLRALFWIDSLCIPTIPDKNDNAVSDRRRKTLAKSKSKAINSMAQLYAGAEQVLVFDPEIQHLPYDAVAGDKYALALCTKCCPWMSRSWPLQEGALGQNLYIRFKDRSVLLTSSIYHRVGLLSFRMLEHYQQFPAILEEGPIPSPTTRLAEVWDSLANRSSTMTEDLPAILATMLDRSAEEILGLRGDRRMKALLKMEETLPLAMFYQPNSLVAGRWNPNVPGPDPGQTSAHPHFGVLRVAQEGLILDTRFLYDTSAVIVHGDPRSDHFTLEINGADGGGMRYSISQDLGKVKKDDSDTSKSLFFLSKLCATGTPKYHGACFSVNTLQSGRLIIRFKTTVLWNYLDTKADPVGETYTNCQWLEDYEGEKFKEVLVDIGTYRF